MINIDELVKKYETICMEYFFEENSKKENRLADKMDRILEKVESNKLEKEFMDKIFKSNEPYVLWVSATKTFRRSYDLYKSFDVIKYLIENAENLVFCEDKERNENERNRIKTFKFSTFEKKIKFYEYIGDDYLYNVYRKFPLDKQNLHTWDGKTKEVHLNLDVLQKNLDLLKELDDKGYIDRLYKILMDKMENSIAVLSISEVIYIFAKYNYKKDYAIKKLKEELERNPTRLNNWTKCVVSFFLNDLLNE